LATLLAPLASANEAPIPEFTFTPERPTPGQEVTFTSTSRDPDGNITSLTWDFGDGVTATAPVATHTYTKAGEFLVILTVIDNEGWGAQLGKKVQVVPDAAAAQRSQALDFLPGWLFWLMPLLVSVLLFSLAYLVVSKGQPAIYNLVFFLFYTASGSKSLMEALAVLTLGANPALHNAFVVLASIASFILAPLFLWFVLVFPRPVIAWLNEGWRGALTLLLAVPFLINLVAGFLSPAATINAFNVYVSILAISCLGLLVYHAWDIDSDEERRRIRMLMISFFILVVSTLILSGFNLAQTAAVQSGNQEGADGWLRAAAVFGLIISPFLELGAAMLLMYAILRYQLMGIEGLVMKATRGTIIALLVPSFFIIIANVIEQFFQETVLQGVRFDFIIAGFVAAAFMVPIQKWTTFMVHRLFPGAASNLPDYQAQRRMEIYEAQMRYSLLDGALNAKEIKVLRRLQLSIGITPDEIDRVLAMFPSVRRQDLVPGHEPAAAPTSGI
jgi:hypothetical protein